MNGGSMNNMTHPMNRTEEMPPMPRNMTLQSRNRSDEEDEGEIPRSRRSIVDDVENAGKSALNKVETAGQGAVNTAEGWGQEGLNAVENAGSAVVTGAKGLINKVEAAI
ncbi:unnamed protein product [Caenorhabditis sp. 36 PRJEB53466]|nr:unnamed protein product [Caenorhabditis sp. 36 PRJEB53466]